jgi:hypothetical protein
MSIKLATEMTHVHNFLIRGLNSIYQQAPHVHDVTDARDLLVYCSAWVMMINHHHDSEESQLFPDLEELAQNPSIMAGNKEQHEKFHDGLEAFQHYAETADPQKYSWLELKDIIDGFAPSLMLHLREEIGTLLALRDLDNRGLQIVFKRAEEVAKGAKHPQLLVCLFIVKMTAVLGMLIEVYRT